jgi:peptidoglycan/LPS O-acetylase OafA/YrhL
VEGLRGVAILAVALYHANVPGMPGGFVGVDVFFVISGFVITGLLLRERARGKISLLNFYARRSRRILPAATVVIVATILASYHWLGFILGDEVAGDGRSAALFVANLHFAAEGANYISAKQAPSPLQNFWSLSVEEQFYLVYPTLFIIVSAAWGRVRTEAKLAAVLVVIIGTSYAWSIHQTSTDATAAYFSTFARAGELALGALVAVGATQLRRIPPLLAAAATWLGAAAIIFSITRIGASVAYPGSAVAVPTLGAALVIAGGTVNPTLGLERLIGLAPFRWLGKVSYSFYLWHWPILMIAAEQAGRTLSVGENLLLLLVALAISVISYFLIENPVRHSRFLSRPMRALPMGLSLVAISVLLATAELHFHP